MYIHFHFCLALKHHLKFAVDNRFIFLASFKTNEVKVHALSECQVSYGVFSRKNNINMIFVLGHLTKMATMPKYGKTKYV